MELLTFSYQAIYYAAALVALLFCSFMISGSETALFSLSPSQVSTLRASQTRSSQSILSLIDEPNKLLSTILIGNNLVNIAAILAANAIVNATIKFNSTSIEFLAKTVVVTFILLICGEIMPKILATYRPIGFARRTAPALVMLRWIFAPLSWVLIKLGSTVTNALTPLQQSVSIEQLHSALEITTESSEQESKMLSGIVSFVGREVVAIMRPRVDVIALDVELTLPQVVETIRGSIHSRLPVYEESFDEIKGVLCIKDLLPHIGGDADFDWRKLLREPYFVPENKKINDLLEDFQAKRQHLAIVVDEYGGTLGIVTLEDILEEIVGEISDESDSGDDFYTQLSATSYIFDGGTHLADFADIVGIDQEIIEAQQGEADTLAGLMMELRGEFFAAADELIFEGWTLRAEEVEGYRITKVLAKIEG